MSSPATAAPATAAAPPQPQKSDKPRPHICTTCLRAFARLEHLKRHERSHTKEKPFECPVCERCFARRDLLLRHQQKLHTGLATTRTRQPRKNSVTIGTLQRQKEKAPPPRPRANSFAAQPSKAMGSPIDVSASTNSWLECTFGRSGASDSHRLEPAPMNAAVDSKASLFGSLFINPDLLPFSLPDNESMGLVVDEESIEFDEDFWLGSLQISSPGTAVSASTCSSTTNYSATDDNNSPASYDTPASVSSMDSTSVKEDAGVNLNFSFPSPKQPQQPASLHASGDIMSRSHMQSKADLDSSLDHDSVPPETILQLYTDQFSGNSSCNTNSTSSLLDQFLRSTEETVAAANAIAAANASVSAGAHPSPTPSATSTASWQSASTSATAPSVTSPVSNDYASSRRQSHKPSTHSSLAKTLTPEMLYGNTQTHSLLLNTLSARSVFPQSPNKVAEAAKAASQQSSQKEHADYLGSLVRDDEFSDLLSANLLDDGSGNKGEKSMRLSANTLDAATMDIDFEVPFFTTMSQLQL
ncbi:hypothetical protein BZA70DRAFT_289821 [Myxozyma melibiosi]|uniref:C2H2-type domain-containing protein n=1 Tax=Myxozyma melibiosi TaxID=54550 RepID=A0ABR1F7T5_9ASCO